MRSTCRHIDLDERQTIAGWRTAGPDVGANAEKLDRHIATGSFAPA
ncbi:hypothetical protein [Agrobacterium sp. B1(2019)]|nr:hypothetical protein [Agrobacterium sp. B1(2019)]